MSVLLYVNGNPQGLIKEESADFLQAYFESKGWEVDKNQDRIKIKSPEMG
jgi:hypothetical protein